MARSAGVVLEKLPSLPRVSRDTPLLPEGEPGFRRMCLRTFEPANDSRDAARLDGRGGAVGDGVVGVHMPALVRAGGADYAANPVDSVVQGQELTPFLARWHRR